MNLNQLSLLGESASPFTDEGDGLTSERKRVRMLLSVGVLDRGVLNRLVKVQCVFLIPDSDAKRHKVYTGLANRCPTSSLRKRYCIPCTEVLVVGFTSKAREGVCPRSLRGAAWVA